MNFLIHEQEIIPQSDTEVLSGILDRYWGEVPTLDIQASLDAQLVMAPTSIPYVFLRLSLEGIPILGKGVQ